MLNAEKYKKELLEFIKKEKSMKFALKEDNTNMFADCRDICCVDCLLSTTEDICPIERMKWLLSEYKEPIKLSKLEYDILKYLSDNTKHMYIVRDGNGNIFLYDVEPEKSKSAPWWTGCGMCHMNMFNKLFQFVQWEDSTPTPIKEVLENCEVVEDAEE